MIDCIVNSCFYCFIYINGDTSNFFALVGSCHLNISIKKISHIGKNKFPNYCMRCKNIFLQHFSMPGIPPHTYGGRD